MNSRTSRKAAIEAFKSREPHRGVFAVRCAATGRVWVGSSPDLDAARNGLWFVLRLGTHRDRALQAEWHAHGEAAFSYEVLDDLRPDMLAMDVAGALKQRKREWAAKEGALTLLP
jgi:hypothetical protein